MVENFVNVLFKIFSISAIRYFIVAGVPFLMFYWLMNPKFIKSKIQNKKPTQTDYVREILHSMQSTAVMSIIAYLVLFTSFTSYTMVYKTLQTMGCGL